MRDVDVLTGMRGPVQGKLRFVWESLVRYYGQRGWTTDRICRILLERHDDRLGSGAEETVRAKRLLIIGI